MRTFKTMSTLICSAALAGLTACTKNANTNFLASPVRCENAVSSAAFGVNPGPVILAPTSASEVSKSVTINGTCVTGLDVDIQMDSTPDTQTPCQQGTFSSTVPIGAPDGSVQLTVSQKSGSNGSTILDRMCFMKNTVPPNVTIVPGSNPTGNTVQSVNTVPTTASGTCESGIPVVVSGPGIQNPVTTQCTNGTFTVTIQVDPGDGTKGLTATQIDPAGNQGQASTSFNVDTTLPVVKITSTIPVVTNKTSFTASGTCTAGLVVQIGKPSAAPSQKPVSCLDGTFTATFPLVGPDGLYTLAVFQVDPAGNIGTDSKSLTKDTTPPAITIASPAANSYVTSSTTFSGACETGLTVSLSGSLLPSAQSVSCTSSAWSLTTTITSNQGSQTLIASQTDAAGNVGTAQQTYQVDTIAPVITITSPAANSYVGSTFTLTGACVSGLTVQVSGGGILPSTSTSCTNSAYSVTVTTSPLDGTKNVTVSQTDPAGNTGSASSSFQRDSVAPVLTIASPANGSSLQAAITVTGTCASGLSVNFTGNITANGSTICTTSGTYSINLTLASPDGSKTITATETDAANNTSKASATYTLDTTPPAVAITSPAANTQAQSGLTVGGTCETGLNVILAGSGVSQSVSTSCTNGAFSAAVTFTSGNGNKLVTATQTDAAGNVGSGSRTFIENTTAPLVTITSPAANSYLPTNFTLQGACVSGLNVVLSGSGIASSVTVACSSSGTYSANLTVSANDGTKTVTATETDAIGNVGTATANYLRDTVPPVLTISSPANGASVQAAITVTGTCAAGLTVNFSGNISTSSSSTTSVTCSTSGTYSIGLTLASPDGSKTITATETDAANNTSQASATYTLDTTPPAVAITSPAANTQAQSGLTVGGTCETGLNVILAGSGVSQSVSTSCTNGAFSAAVTFTSGNGNKLVTATQTDAAGNVGSGSRTFVENNTPPLITITSPAANSYLPTNFTLQGACVAGLTVNIGGNGVASSTSVTCSSSGTYSANLTVSANDGTKTVTATETDAIGNVGTATANYLRDTVPPVLTISSPANGSTLQASITVTGTCSAGLTVSFSGGISTSSSGSSSVTCSSSGTYSIGLTLASPDGSKTITATETDAAGNTTTTSATYTLDTTPPVLTIASPTNGSTLQAGITVTGACEAGLTVSFSGNISTSSSSTTSVTCSTSGTYSIGLTLASPDGSKTITASETDIAGNNSKASATYTLDTTPPVLTIASPSNGSSLQASITVTGTCAPGLTVSFSGNISTSSSSPTSVTCLTSGTYSIGLTLASPDGSKTITASETDIAGNKSTASATYTLDTTPPAIAITSPATGSNVTSSITLAGTCETGLTVNVTGDLTSTSGSCTSGAFSIPVSFTTGLGTKNVSASQTDAAGNIGTATAQYNVNANTTTDTFTSDATFGKVDIMFVDDNSGSMDPHQASLGTKFSAFSSALTNIDWQIGITTTDCSTDAYGICGSLLTMAGTNSYILTPSTPSYADVFNNTIQRPETKGCLNTGTCPSNDSQPLLAAATGITKYNTNNTGFFRSDAALAIVVLSDADEGDTGGSTYANRPSQLVSTFTNTFGSSKKLSVYSIIIDPGDTNCYNQMNSLSGGYSFYGAIIAQAVGLTSNGINTSICASDYTVPLQSIAQSVMSLTDSVTLSHTPIAGSVSVTFSPNQSITYTVSGNQVIFNSPPSAGTQIQVTYQY